MPNVRYRYLPSPFAIVSVGTLLFTCGACYVAMSTALGGGLLSPANQLYAFQHGLVWGVPGSLIGLCVVSACRRMHEHVRTIAIGVAVAWSVAVAGGFFVFVAAGAAC